MIFDIDPRNATSEFKIREDLLPYNLILRYQLMLLCLQIWLSKKEYTIWDEDSMIYHFCR